MTTTRLVATVIATVIATVLVAASTACGTAPPQAPETGAQQATSHGAADVAFARDMIPHHRQAVVLADMVPAHTGNAELRMLATHIGGDQQAEIRTLDGLLAQWGESGDHGGVGSHHHSMTMAGMVDQPTLDRLGTLHDANFDTLWVTSMIDHHRGAIAMASEEIAHGQSADAVEVARQMITAQEREIAMLTHLISASQ